MFALVIGLSVIVILLFLLFAVYANGYNSKLKEIEDMQFLLEKNWNYKRYMSWCKGKAQYCSLKKATELEKLTRLYPD